MAAALAAGGAGGVRSRRRCGFRGLRLFIGGGRQRNRASGRAAAAFAARNLAFLLAPDFDRGVVLLQRLGEDVATRARRRRSTGRWLRGLSAASIAARPGLQIGVGGRPSI